MPETIRAHNFQDPFARLTPRERQVACLAGGEPTLQDKEVASVLAIETTTVRAHMRAILSALNIRSRADLGRIVDRARLYDEYRQAMGASE